MSFSTENIRNQFISYFVKEGHTHIAASPLIPHNDPSLMFVNSGMVQFKNVFTGQETRDYTRAVTSQKALRAGGKHNDLDNVGYTARHHTFFEMLGNFSFGDYFKEEAIYYAWQLLTKEFKLDPSRLYVTIYHTDDEAAKYWQKIAGFKDDRIIRINTNDNFWSMGDLGPCGPCSEIFYDHGEHITGGLPGTKDQDGDRYVEIWNLVFMQFEQVDKDTRIPLPKKSVDTGMGLERVAAVIQGVHDNYDIDLFKEIIANAEVLFKVKAVGEARFSYRVIADHLRACAFLIADGVMPANEGRGYVLRRIMRRCMRHANMLGAKEPVVYKLLPKLVDLMGGSYPQLKTAEDFITEILKQEENRFRTTLERGLRLLGEETSFLSDGGKLPGDVAFKLYDTYGFPLDLTADILKKRNIKVDVEGFELNMQQQKERARKSWYGSGEKKDDNIWFDLKAEFGSTEFLGYSLDQAQGNVLALLKDNKKLDQINTKGEQFILIANQTPFYGESGGQMGDIGVIKAYGSTIKVVDTLKYLGAVHAHVCELEDGEVKVGEICQMEINVDYRHNLRIHHSATHILHAVLRELLGTHITQKGSLVAQDRLRFDFSHPKALTSEEIEQIEDKVNKVITANSKISTTLMSTDEAIASGAMALFGEKYESEVRVVAMGGHPANETYSIELCGGTHASRTGDIGSFRIISESAIAAGVRRIEAVCGESALRIAKQNDKLINEISAILKAGKGEIIGKIDSLLQSNKILLKNLDEIKLSTLDLKLEQIETAAEKVSGIRLLYKLVDDLDTGLLRMAAQKLADKAGDLVVVYIAKSGSSDKLSIVVAVSKAVSSKIHAGNLAKELSLFLDGSGGGGQATIAQAGGGVSGKLAEVNKKIKKFLDDISA